MSGMLLVCSVLGVSLVTKCSCINRSVCCLYIRMVVL